MKRVGLTLFIIAIGVIAIALLLATSSERTGITIIGANVQRGIASTVQNLLNSPANASTGNNSNAAQNSPLIISTNPNPSSGNEPQSGAGTNSPGTGTSIAPTPRATQGEPVAQWWGEINRVCRDKWQLDPHFIAAVVKIESWFDERAENQGEKESYQAGQTVWFEQFYGKGLMQPTGPWIAGTPYPREQDWQYNMPPEAQKSQAPRMDDALNGTQNLDRGCWYFKALLTHYNGNYLKAAAAYRYGWFGVDAGTYNESSYYSQQVNTYYQQYKSN